MVFLRPLTRAVMFLFSFESCCEVFSCNQTRSIAADSFCILLPSDSWYVLSPHAVGVCVIFGFAISLRFAHASLTHKLKARMQSTTTSPQIAVVPLTNTKMNHVAGRRDTLLRATSVPVMSSFSLGDSDSASSDEDNEGKVDKVYTIGCFDLFRRGHV